MDFAVSESRLYCYLSSGSSSCVFCIFRNNKRQSSNLQRLHYWKEKVKNPADAREAPGEGRVAHRHNFRDVAADAEKQYLHIPLLTVAHIASA